jgi:hypothetical protein
MPGYFGTDSNTAPGIGGMPQQFYLGRLGYGTTIDGTYFNSTAARATPSGAVSGYWGVEGPFAAPSGMAAYDWGHLQGQTAVRAWNQNPYCCGANVFADLESGFGGWFDPQGAPHQDLNASVLNGWLDAVVSTPAVLCEGSTTRLTPGVYFNMSDSGSWFSGAYMPSQPFVYWGVGNIQGVCACSCATANCAPCDPSCDTLSAVEERWQAAVVRQCFAGQRIVIWQFWISSCGCSGNFDFSPQSGNPRFLPAGC